MPVYTRSTVSLIPKDCYIFCCFTFLMQYTIAFFASDKRMASADCFIAVKTFFIDTSRRTWHHVNCWGKTRGLVTNLWESTSRKDLPSMGLFTLSRIILARVKIPVEPRWIGSDWFWYLQKRLSNSINSLSRNTVKSRFPTLGLQELT